MAEDIERRVCAECIGDVFLRARVEAVGVLAICSECGEFRRAVPFCALAEIIDEAFRSTFELTAYEQHPDAYQVFMVIAGIEEDLARRIEEHLFEEIGKIAEQQGKENPYDYSTGFARIGTPLFWQDQRWQRFCDSLRKKERYINPEATAWLDDVFAELDSHRTWDAKSVIRNCQPGEPGSHFYRARAASSEDELRRILEQPVMQIGPLPPGLGRAGRLNAAGISVFYGAVDVTTCISEIRPPVGMHVVIARFDVLRPLRLLDCEALDRLALDASPFDPDFIRKRDRAHFLRSFSEQIARPVLPGDETLGYVPTQVIAEYLAQCLVQPIDGILYKSTQRGSALDNVMLFNRAARVAPFPHHTHYIDAYIRTIDIDAEDFDDSITIAVKEIGAVSPPEPLDLLDGTPRPVSIEPLPHTFAQPDLDDDRPLTLRLAHDSIAVHFIRATEYDRPERRVTISSAWPDAID